MAYKRVPVADDLAPVLSAVAALLQDSFDAMGMVSDGQAALEGVSATCFKNLFDSDLIPATNEVLAGRVFFSRKVV